MQVNDTERLSAKNIEWLCPSLNDANFESMRAFGMASWLWIQSPLHRDWPSYLLGNSIWPAITHRQFLLARDQTQRPIAYVSWAMLDENAERKYLQDANSLQTEDWNSGDRIWFIDWITPFGASLAVARKIENEIFPNDAGHSLHVKKDRRIAKIYDHFGKNVTPERKKIIVDQLKKNLEIVFQK